ncbi:MAG: M20 family metallopeptidase, partial [Halobacteriota archaeon]
LTLQITTVGRSAHASRPELGDNAIMKMANLLEHVGKLKLQRHPILGNETFAVSSIFSHAAANVIPDRCTIGVEYRYVPPHAAKSVVKVLRTQLPDTSIEFTDDLAHSTPPFYLPEHEIIDLLKESLQNCGISPVTRTMDASTDAARFNMAGIPTVVFGPGGIDQAHTQDEWIDLDELMRASEVFCDLIKRVLMGKNSKSV